MQKNHSLHSAAGEFTAGVLWMATRKFMFLKSIFQNSERSGDDNYVQDLDIPTEIDPDVWTMRGVALLCQEPKED